VFLLQVQSRQHPGYSGSGEMGDYCIAAPWSSPRLRRSVCALLPVWS